ncbi:hypothetical protein V8E54_012816 [Elaphomyces granulatus]
MADDIEDGKEDKFKFDPKEGCTFGCELPTRYRLPCKHWMHNSIVERVPLPLSLFHPRRHFDGPAVLKDHWVMTWALEQEAVPGPSLVDRHAGDRYAACGVQMVEESALAVLDKLKSLPPGMAEAFANSFATGSNRLLAQQEKILKNRQEFPTTLPAPLVNETSLQYKRGKRRAMTGLEIAEERERDASRQRRRDEREAAALAAAEERLEVKEKERRKEQEMLAANWLAFSEPDVETDEDQQPRDPQVAPEVASEEAFSSDSEPCDKPGSQYRPFDISSESLLMVDRVDLGGRLRSLLRLFSHSKRRSSWGLYLLLVPEPRPGL